MLINPTFSKTNGKLRMSYLFMAQQFVQSLLNNHRRRQFCNAPKENNETSR